MIDRLVMDALCAVAVVGVLLLVRGAHGVPRYAAPRCRRCGYDVRRTTERPDACPECGMSFDGAHAVRFARRRRSRRTMATGLLMIVAAAVVVITTRLEYALTAPGQIAAATGAPAAVTSGALNAMTIDERIAAMNRQPIDTGTWQAVATDMNSEAWTTAHSRAVIDELTQYLKSDAAQHPRSTNDWTSRPFGSATSMIEPMLTRLASAGRLDDPAVARAAFDHLLGSEPMIDATVDDDRHGRVHGTVGFRNSGAVPMCALLHAHAVRINGSEPTSIERWLRWQSGVNQLFLSHGPFESMTEPIEFEIDLEYAIVPRSALPASGEASLGPPSTWAIPESDRVRTTLSSTITPPERPDAVAVRGAEADAALRAATTIEPIHVFRDHETIRAFIAFSIVVSDCPFDAHPALDFHIGDVVHQVVHTGRHSRGRTNQPAYTVIYGEALIPIPDGLPDDVTEATVTIRSQTVPETAARVRRRDLSGPFWEGELDVQVPIERADLNPDES